MVIKDNENVVSLKSFFVKVRKFFEIRDVLNEGASEDSIEQLERQMSVNLPPIYKEFLKACNGGRLFILCGVTLLEVYDSLPYHTDSDRIYLHEGNKPEYRGDIPENYFIIAKVDNGDVICILEYERHGKKYTATRDIAECMYCDEKYSPYWALCLKPAQAKSYKEEGFCFTRYDLPFNVFISEIARCNLHWHMYLEFIYVISGKPVITINGRKYYTTADDFIIINTQNSHMLETSEDGTEILVIQFEPWVVNSNIGSVFESKYLIPFLHGEYKYSRQMRLVKGCELQLILMETLNDFNERKPGYELNIKANIYRMFSWLIRNSYIVVSPNNNSKTTELSKIKEIHSYIDSNFYEDISLNTAAQMACMNYYYFCRAFKKVTGKNFIEYLNSVRLAEAEKLLASTSEQIDKIAERVGFHNVSYFDQLFRKEKGMSPGCFRKQKK